MSAPDRTLPPKSLPTPPPAPPEFADFLFDSGFRLRIARVARLPEIAIRLVIDAGAAAEPAAQNGVAALTSKVLPAGAAGRTAMQMAEWLDHMGASLASGVAHDAARFSLHCLSDGIDEALDYLAAVILKPEFEPVEVERVRAELLDEVRRSRDEPAELAADALSGTVFGAHPYGRPVRGTVETLEALDESRIRDFWTGAYAAGTSFLVAAGDLDPGELAAAIERRFGAWSPGAGRRPAPDEPNPAPDAGAITLVDRPSSQQSEIRIGAIGLPRGHEDEVPVLVMNAILGGLFNSRLNMNLREDKGWTYGARSSFLMRRVSGPFIARAAVDTAVTARAFDEMLAEIRSMIERPPSEEELELARNALILSLPRQFETTSQVAAKEAERVAYDLPEDWWQRYPDLVRAVHAEDVVRVAGRYLDRERLVLVAVGDGSVLRSELASLAPVRDLSAP